MLHISIVHAHDISKQIPQEKKFPSGWKYYKTIGSYTICAFIKIWSHYWAIFLSDHIQLCEHASYFYCARSWHQQTNPSKKKFPSGWKYYKTIGLYTIYAFIEIWSTWQVWRALKKLELLSATPRATLTHISCSLNFPCASYLDERTLTYEPIVILINLHYDISADLVLITLSLVLCTDDQLIDKLRCINDESSTKKIPCGCMCHCSVIPWKIKMWYCMYRCV